MPESAPPRPLHPRHWPSWILVGIIYALGRLPFPLLWMLGQGLGHIAYLVAIPRRRVAERNLALCLPELNAVERRRLARRHFGWLGVAALAVGVGWGSPPKRLARIAHLHGREHIDDCLAAGQPVIVLLPHFIGLDLAGIVFAALVDPGVFMYQKIRNPVIDRQVHRERVRFGSVSVERREGLRGLIHTIKQGAPCFYLPDQDGGRRGIFVPFFGVAASTVPMLGRFAALTNAVVVPAVPRFLPWGRGLEVTFDPPLTGFPAGEPVVDTTRMNEIIEDCVRRVPAQYFWVHRRFKTRPPGAPPIYPRKRRRR